LGLRSLERLASLEIPADPALLVFPADLLHLVGLCQIQLDPVHPVHPELLVLRTPEPPEHLVLLAHLGHLGHLADLESHLLYSRTSNDLGLQYFDRTEQSPN